MIYDIAFKAGLVVGLETEQVMVYDEETEKMQEEPCNAIHLHLGVLTLSVIFE